MACVSRVTWSMVDLPCRRAGLLPREQWVDDWVDTSVDESLKDFKGDSQQGYGTITLWVPQWLLFQANGGEVMWRPGDGAPCK